MRENPPSIRTGLFVLLAAWQLAGCSSAPVREETAVTRRPRAETGERVAAAARDLLGTLYRRGGTTPRGFDCSGLVYYAHQKAGLRVPRRSRDQLEYSRPVSLQKLRPGDVLFFRLSRGKVSHVGIYTGRHRFIHAPSRGKQVSLARLDNPYWEEHLIAAGRLY